MLYTTIYLLAVLVALVACAFPLGKFINNSFINTKLDDSDKLNNLLNKIEQPILNFLDVDQKDEMYGSTYIKSLLKLNLTVFVISFIAFFNQGLLNFENRTYESIRLDTLLHTIISYITNTDQSHCIPELQLTSFVKFLILPVLMVTSSATGISTAVMFVRSVTVSKTGNFYVDFVKSITRILLPLSLILSLLFTICGVPNSFNFFISHDTLEGINQTISLGPVAAFQAIKIIGQNGGSLYNINSAHPLSNPSYLSNFIEIVSMLLIPSAIIFTLGNALGKKKQSIVIFLTVFLILAAECYTSAYYELQPIPKVSSELNINEPNWYGKETRFGIVSSSIFQVAASNASGATNSSIESFHPATVAISYFNLCIQAIFGGQGLGPIYIMIFMLYTAYFVGLMIGRSPLIFERRIEKKEIILSSLILLINPVTSLIASAITISRKVSEEGESLYSHVHEFTRIIYEFTSAAANNGGGLEGLMDSSIYFNVTTSTIMICGWFLSITLMIMLASSLKEKKVVLINNSDTFKTDSVLFCILLVFISVTLNLIIVFPFIVTGPITEIVLNQ